MILARWRPAKPPGLLSGPANADWSVQTLVLAEMPPSAALTLATDGDEEGEGDVDGEGAGWLLNPEKSDPMIRLRVPGVMEESWSTCTLLR